jgi:hypothetical protein
MKTRVVMMVKFMIQMTINKYRPHNKGAPPPKKKVKKTLNFQ